MLTAIVYRLFFHPLAKYPGPVIARLTNAYAMYHAWTGRRHLDLHRLHKQYGSVVRIAPNEICFNTDTAYNQIYGTKANTRKADFYRYTNVSNNAFSTIDKHEAAQKRRIMLKPFSERSLKDMEPLFVSNVDIFCDRLLNAEPNFNAPAMKVDKGSWSAPRNMARWTDYLSYDILGDICYGRSFETLTSTKNHYSLEFINGISSLVYISAQMTWVVKSGLHFIAFLPLFRRWWRFKRYSDEVIQEREARFKAEGKDGRRDMYRCLAEARDPETGEGLSREVIKDEMVAFLVAGEFHFVTLLP